MYSQTYLERLPLSEREQLLSIIGQQKDPEDQLSEILPENMADSNMILKLPMEIKQTFGGNSMESTEPQADLSKINFLQAKLDKLKYFSIYYSSFKSQQCKKLIQENTGLKARSKIIEKENNELQAKNQTISRDLENLRGLVGSLLKDASLSKIKDMRFQKALEQLELTEIIPMSEPPIDLYFTRYCEIFFI